MPITGSGFNASMSYFSTSSKGSNFYNIVCLINPCNNGFGWYAPYSLKVSVINCVTPSIIEDKINLVQTY